jgi:hypothetical protein
LRGCPSVNDLGTGGLGLKTPSTIFSGLKNYIDESIEKTNRKFDDAALAEPEQSQ